MKLKELESLLSVRLKWVLIGEKDFFGCTALRCICTALHFTPLHINSFQIIIIVQCFMMIALLILWHVLAAGRGAV